MQRIYRTRVCLLAAVMLVVSGAYPVAEAEAQRRRPRGKAARQRGVTKAANMPEHWVWPPSSLMKEAGKRCLDDLTRLGVKWRAPVDTVPKVATPVIIDSLQLGRIKLTPISRPPPFVMDCHLARALAEQSALFAEAGIRELRFSSIHDYRRVRLRRRTLRALSRHALGLAIDVYEIVDAAGETHRVRTQYWRVAAFRAVEARLRTTKAFRALLTPGNDRRSHYDHFHFEAAMTLTPPAAPIAVPAPARPEAAR